MRKIMARPASIRSAVALGAACLAIVMPHVPALAGGDITNFKVRNCTSERIFVCSFDKTDSLMKVPYKAKGIQPTDQKQLGCASLGKCKVIIGVSDKKKGKHKLSKGMQAATSSTLVSAAALNGSLFVVGGVATLAATGINLAGATMVVSMGAGAGVTALAVGGAIAGLEISDGWSDGEICNQVRKVAQKAGVKPKHFLKNGNTYTVIPQYATDKDGNPYVYADGTAVFAYTTKKGKSCPAPLKTQLIPN
jgi:hypothetical protein